MFKELGELFSWLLIVSFECTLLNYGVKFINKNWGKNNSAMLLIKKQ